MSSNDIQQLIDNGYLVICDTNVFLHIYRYSPEFSDFALRCVQTISQSIVLPSTVKYEYLKHYRAYFGDMEKRVRKMDTATKTEITSAGRKVLKICDNLQTLKYPDIS